MANETESVGITSDQDQAQVISFFPASNKVEEAEFKLLSDTVRTLPAHAVKDLLSIGVCIGCIFRLFGVSERVCSCASLSTSMLCSILEKAIGLEGIKFDNGLIAREGSSSQEPSQLVGTGQSFCRLCMGILQFAYLDDNNLLVQRSSANEFALVIADIVKQGCHQIDSFSLEVSIPPSISGNEEAVGLYMKTNYASEFWFQQLCISELANTKDILKLSITGPLERLLGVKSGSSSFRVRLTYTPRDALTSTQNTMVNKQLNKRRKTGSDDKAGANNGSGASGIEGSNFCKGEEYASNKFSSNGFQDHGIFGSIKLQLEKVSQPFRLTFLCYRTPIYIGGRYFKYSRNVSQTRWIIDDERMGEASVEEIVGGSILPVCHGDSYKFHAAGREDIDVRMLGSGRPFLIEIQNAHTMPCEASIKDMESKINNVESKLVRVKNLKVLGNQGWNLMREGEAEKQKQYVALVWISRSLHDDDMQAISLCKDMKILQRTPIRVLHRRSPLEREKIIHWMKIEPIAGNSQYFLLHLCTQAGTYIKEFVHGDLGRTHPSIGSILGCRAEIQQLDVTDVKMDCFLTE